MLSIPLQVCEEDCNVFQFLLALYEQNPLYLVSFIVGVFIVGVFIIYIAGIIQGRGISLWGLKIDPKITPTTSTEIDMDGLAERISEKLSKEKFPKDQLRYSPPELSEQQTYIYSARQDIRDKISDIVMSHGGGWAGVSMASFGTFFELAKDHKLITERLAGDINEFMMYTRTLLNEDPISESGYKNVQEFYELIRIQLDSTPRRPLERG